MLRGHADANSQEIHYQEVQQRYICENAEWWGIHSILTGPYSALHGLQMNILSITIVQDKDPILLCFPVTRCYSYCLFYFLLSNSCSIMTSMPLNPKKQLFKFWVYDLNKTSDVVHVDTSVDVCSDIS